MILTICISYAGSASIRRVPPADKDWRKHGFQILWPKIHNLSALCVKQVSSRSTPARSGHAKKHRLRVSGQNGTFDDGDDGDGGDGDDGDDDEEDGGRREEETPC